MATKKHADIGYITGVLTETGVLGSTDQIPPTCSTGGLVRSAMRLSRSWEEGPWHAS